MAKHQSESTQWPPLLAVDVGQAGSIVPTRAKIQASATTPIACGVGQSQQCTETCTTVQQPIHMQLQYGRAYGTMIGSSLPTCAADIGAGAA